MFDYDCGEVELDEHWVPPTVAPRVGVVQPGVQDSQAGRDGGVHALSGNRCWATFVAVAKPRAFSRSCSV